MFCFTVLSSFTLFTWRKLKVHYWRKEVWERGLWSGGRRQCSPRREVPGLSTGQRAARAGCIPGVGQPLPCSWITPQSIGEGWHGWEEESAGGSLSGWWREMLVGPGGPGEGAATLAQHWQGPGRRCWVEHRGMEVTLLYLLSQHTGHQPHAGQLAGAVWQKRNLLWPQQFSPWLSSTLFHIWSSSRASSQRKALGCSDMV